MLRYNLYPINDNIKTTMLKSIYHSMDKYVHPNVLNTVKYDLIKEPIIEKYSFFSSLLIAFLAGYHFRLMIEYKNIS